MLKSQLWAHEDYVRAYDFSTFAFADLQVHYALAYAL